MIESQQHDTEQPHTESSEPAGRTTSEKGDQPVASLLSRISGLSTGDPQPASSSSSSPSDTPHSPPPASASSESQSRPRPNTSSALFGRALAGVKSGREGGSAPSASASSTTTTPAVATSAQPSASTGAKKETKEPSGKGELLPEDSKDKKAGKMAQDLMDEPISWGSTTHSKAQDRADDGWGNTMKNGNSNGNAANGRDNEPIDAGMSDTGSGLISNDFQVQVKLADQQADPNNPLYSVKRFEDLPIHESLMKGIYAAGFKKPSKIQENALPMLLNNPPRNLIGQSQSGTGKTAAFTLNMLSRVDPSIMAPQAICLAPSRELARQIQEVVNKIGVFTEIKTFLAVPGSWTRGQKIDKHILIGTPGTLVDMLSRRGTIFDPKHIRVFVLDEADEMVAMQGLGDQTSRIQKMLPRGVQVVLFSATFPPDVQEFAQRCAPEANQIFLKKEDVTIDTIKQLWLECDGENQKYEALSALYDIMSIGQSIVFCKRKDTADNIANRLTQEGHSVASLHGDKQTDERDTILDGFREGKTKVLITTNVIARGIDIQQVNMVVNYDVPDLGPGGNFRPDIETYIHRIGRTGRFGRKGCSVIFAHDDRSKDEIHEIMAQTGRQMKRIDARSTTDLEQLEKALKLAMKGPQ
ncbi:P-loop containing nucleoside triphosphate hydrolase protein [Kockovaella imperatae]|uniref:RNA helicase n=1 Tax=Kockovaella imperatae TaxID=4999 RepID=A0A1Y1UMZ5_9TREE|nr:P-loop containing nucleoside triphosphate hydrolase protein [Kockovaella imperatae]ORX39433.1 P-loop containing nucleoside triphosphate hydrolase protein [Kockovaella imperatae]